MKTSLKELRIKNNLKVSDLAKALNKSNSLIYGYEDGSYTPPIDVFRQLSEIYGISIEYLAGFDESYREFSKSLKFILDSLDREVMLNDKYISEEKKENLRKAIVNILDSEESEK